MNMLSTLLRRAPVEEFAKSLAADVAKRYPPALDKEPGKRPSVNRLTRIVEDLCKRVVEFHTEHRLGWMAKAKLANAFRWELAELGYGKEFVNLATEAVVVHLGKIPPTK
jgi:hypothetical protein